MTGEMTRAERLSETFTPFKEAAKSGDIEGAGILFQAVVAKHYKGNSGEAIIDALASTLGTRFQTAISAEAIIDTFARNGDQAVQNMGAAIRATLTA